MPAFAIISGYFSKSDAPGSAADGPRDHRHPAAVRDLRGPLDADEVDRRGPGEPEPHAAVVDAVVPARPRHLPARAALPRAAALAAAVDRADLDRRGLPAQHRLDALAVAHARAPAVLRARAGGCATATSWSGCACCGDRPWWVFVASRRRSLVAAGWAAWFFVDAVASDEPARVAVLRRELLVDRRHRVVGRRRAARAHGGRPRACRRRSSRCCRAARTGGRTSASTRCTSTCCTRSCCTRSASPACCATSSRPGSGCRSSSSRRC